MGKYSAKEKDAEVQTGGDDVFQEEGGATTVERAMETCHLDRRRKMKILDNGVMKHRKVYR